MGVEARVVVHAPAQQEAAAGAAAAASIGLLAQLDATLSDWRDDSELSRAVRQAVAGPVPVSEELFAALARARDFERLSGGAFDVTVGPLSRLWRRARVEGVPPRPDEIAEAQSRVGGRWLVLDEATCSMSLLREGMAIDLGGIGKGFAADRALERLVIDGFPRALVAVGGDLALGDPPPGRPGWTIRAGCGAPGELRELVVSGCGVSTSGDTEQFVLVDDLRVSHILDVVSGTGLVGAPCVTALARDATTSDAFATLANLVGRHEARRLAAAHGVRLLVDEPGFARLFDGWSLAGFTEQGGRYDGDAEWTVEDQCIVGRQRADRTGGLLYTERILGACEVECEVRIDHPFDSGLFLLMTPDQRGLQVTLDDRPGGELAAIYSDGFLAHERPVVREVWRRGDWNHVAVRLERGSGGGWHVVVRINGTLVQDWQPDEAAAEGFAREGRIGLQVHGGEAVPLEQSVKFRELAVREL